MAEVPPPCLQIRQLSTGGSSTLRKPRPRPHNPEVTSSSGELDELLAHALAIRASDHPRFRSAIRSGLHARTLVRLLPGIIVASCRIRDPDARIVAASLWRPDGVLMGRAAARLSFASGVGVGTVQVSGSRATRRSGFAVVEARVKPEFIRFRGGIPHTEPSLTVVDLLRVGDREPLYEALRTRAVTLASLRAALRANPAREGNPAARRELWLARENPWSAGEAELHSYLRAHAITGWRGNVRVEAGGAVYFADALFRRQRLILELDGLDHHTSVPDREYDYRRRAALLAEGYRVMGLTLGMIRTDPARTAERIAAARAITSSGALVPKMQPR